MFGAHVKSVPQRLLDQVNFCSAGSPSFIINDVCMPHVSFALHTTGGKLGIMISGKQTSLSGWMLGV